MERTIYLDLIKKQLKVNPVCAILGARQVGKTTLARQFAKKYGGKVEFFDLENPLQLASLESPMLTLSRFSEHLIVIDEIQRRPDLFPIIRVLVDDPNNKYSFLILGSASKELIRQSSETLAGRIGYIDLPPFTLFEVSDTDKLFLRGGFPKSYLAESNEDSFLWREGYITTFLERDLPALGFDVPAERMYKFWMMLCFYHGQAFNASEIANSIMLSDKTVTRYLEILAGTFMIRILYPWFENIKKRQTKKPKIYFRDSGIFNALSLIKDINDVVKTPKIGSMWEGFALEQVIDCLQVKQNECYFWSTQNEAELDLLIFKDRKKIGFEFKYTDSPKRTRSMNIAIEDLSLDHLYLIFPGNVHFDIDEKITACGLNYLESLVENKGV